MFLRLPLAATLLAMGLVACHHDITQFGKPRGPEGDAHDGSVEGAVLHDDAGDRGDDAGTQLSDAGTPFPYRWLKNNPGDGKDEGTVAIELRCTHDGTPSDDCLFGCAYDAVPVASCHDELTVYAAPGKHKLCVTVRPPESDLTFSGREATQCVTWNTKPYSHPFMWQAVTPNPKSTALDAALLCAQEPAVGAAEPRADCQFRCSLDHIPYAACTGTFAASLAKGDHELRVETCGPPGHEAEGICRVRVLSFSTDADAAPPVPFVDAPSTAILSREELGADLASLIDPYVIYAVVCGDEHSLEINDIYIREYLSYVKLRIARPTEVAIKRCREALDSDPIECAPSLPGFREGPNADLMLHARLPEACRGYWGSGEETPDVGGLSAGYNGMPCLTHAECSGACDRQKSWTTNQPDFGFCGQNSPAEEGTMCHTRGCLPGLYCGGVCIPQGQVGVPCQTNREGVDCASGLTCTGSLAHPNCAPAFARIGEHCKIPSDCAEGVCDREKSTCVAASEAP